MIVCKVEFLLNQATIEWQVSSWQAVTPGNVTTVTYDNLDDALERVLYLFREDLDIDTVLQQRARASVVAANAATITTAKNALKTAEGL